MSRCLLAHLADEPHVIADVPRHGGDVLTGDDVHLTLALCYAVGGCGIVGADDAWEWHPSVVSLRTSLEGVVESALRAVVAAERVRPPRLLAEYLAEQATPTELREFAMHRAADLLEEPGRIAAAVARAPERMRALIADIAAAAGTRDATGFQRALDDLAAGPPPGGYLDLLPGVTLACANLTNMLALNRRLHAAFAAHVAVRAALGAEIDAAFVHGLQRVGAPADALRWFERRADAAARQAFLARNVRADLDGAADAAFGIAATHALAARFEQHVLSAWSRGETSLRRAVLVALSA